MEKLSRRSEEILREILDHRDEKENCDTGYWKKRFEDAHGAEEMLLRSQFKELIESEMISVGWGDDYPYIMYVLSNGISYFEEKQNISERQINNSYTNYFGGAARDIQIQQGTINSTQTQNNSLDFDEGKIQELIDMIKRYDAVLETEFGKESAEKLRKAIDELSKATFENKNQKLAGKALNYIRDLSVNAGGGLIATGIIHMLKMIAG
mgnify:CR=1 FL=1